MAGSLINGLLPKSPAAAIGSSIWPKAGTALSNEDIAISVSFSATILPATPPNKLNIPLCPKPGTIEAAANPAAYPNIFANANPIALTGDSPSPYLKMDSMTMIILSSGPNWEPPACLAFFKVSTKPNNCLLVCAFLKFLATNSKTPSFAFPGFCIKLKILPIRSSFFTMSSTVGIILFWSISSACCWVLPARSFSPLPISDALFTTLPGKAMIALPTLLYALNKVDPTFPRPVIAASATKLKFDLVPSAM